MIQLSVLVIRNPDLPSSILEWPGALASPWHILGVSQVITLSSLLVFDSSTHQDVNLPVAAGTLIRKWICVSTCYFAFMYVQGEEKRGEQSGIIHVFRRVPCKVAASRGEKLRLHTGFSWCRAPEIQREVLVPESFTADSTTLRLWWTF